MSRKIKIIKKNEKDVESNKVYDTKGFIKLLLIILGIVLVLYLVISIFITKDFFLLNKDDEINSNYSALPNTIYTADTFTQTDKEYYVFFYDKEDPQYTTVNTRLSNKKDKVYLVDINTLSSDQVSDKGNKNAKTHTELKINGLTIIKIEDGKNTAYLEGKDQILAHFK